MPALVGALFALSVTLVSEETDLASCRAGGAGRAVSDLLVPSAEEGFLPCRGSLSVWRVGCAALPAMPEREGSVCSFWVVAVAAADAPTSPFSGLDAEGGRCVERVTSICVLVLSRLPDAGVTTELAALDVLAAGATEGVF